MKYRTWCVSRDEKMEWGRTVDGEDESEAAQNWAAHSDWSHADFAVAAGKEQVVVAVCSASEYDALDEDEKPQNVKLFEVSGRMVPLYEAKEVK